MALLHLDPPQLAAVPLPGQFPPITVPIGAYTPKERVFLHMATRQKRRVFLGYFPLLSSNSSDDPSDVGRDGHRDGALGELGVVTHLHVDKLVVTTLPRYA